MGLRGSISVFPSGTSSAGADEVCGHPCCLPGSMFFLRPALGQIEHLNLTRVCAVEADGFFSRGRKYVKEGEGL